MNVFIEFVVLGRPTVFINFGIVNSLLEMRLFVFF